MKKKTGKSRRPPVGKIAQKNMMGIILWPFSRCANFSYKYILPNKIKYKHSSKLRNVKRTPLTHLNQIAF